MMATAHLHGRIKERIHCSQNSDKILKEKVKMETCNAF